MIFILFALFVIASYFTAAIPFGVVFARVFCKKDIRTLGSCNIGATNVSRHCGRLVGVTTLIMDGLKGALPTFLAQHFFGDFIPSAPYLVGVVCVLSHCFSVYIKFRGGKGVATSFFVVAVLCWPLGLFTLAVWICSIVAFRYVSVASIASALAVSVLSFVVAEDTGVFYITWLCLAIALVIIFKHIANISRIVRDVEPRAFDGPPRPPNNIILR